MTEIDYIKGSYVGKKFKPGMEFDYLIAVPKINCEEFAILVEHDGPNYANINSMLRLADEGKAPYCICIGVNPGRLMLPDGENWRDMRMNNYDVFDREYGDFLVYELIPHIVETHGFKISPNPEMHMISGGSSGGISAFVVAWFHPNYFRRVYMSSPSLLAMGRGNEIPYLIRKYEPKPFRVYQEHSENEPDDYFGWSRAVDDASASALCFAGYDFKAEFFPGEGHCSRYCHEGEAYKRNEWIWHGWKDEPIRPLAESRSRVKRVIPVDSRWEPCETFPERVKEEAPTTLTEAFDHVMSSSEDFLWYAGRASEDIVYKFPKRDGGALESGLLHVALHTIPRYEPKGAIDMVVDPGDRLFVLTAIGVQCVRSYGLIDVILDLPDDAKPLAINLTDALYVKTEKGIYRRVLTDECVSKDGPHWRSSDYYS
jgi:hypothetical protein